MRRIKTGWVVTATICLCIIFARSELLSGVVMVVMTLRGEPRYYTVLDGLESLRETNRRESLKKEIKERLRLLRSDPQAGLDLYGFESREIWVPKGNSKDLAQILEEQKQDAYNTDSISRIRAGDSVLDVGAHVGIFTRRALDLGASRVIAIEPVPTNLECLRRNLKKEIESREVIVYPKGAWNNDVDSLKMFVYPTNNISDSFVLINRSLAISTVELPVTTIDKMVEDLSLTRVDFIKMDIEGAERYALVGATKTIQRFHPRMAISVYHKPDDPVVIPLTVRAAWSGYRQQCDVYLLYNSRIFPEVYYYW